MTDFDFDAGFEELIEELSDLQEQASGGGSYFVGTAVEYSIYLEFGSSKMDPEPFVRPALAEARRDLESFIAANTTTSADDIETARELVRTVAFALERRIKEIITEKGLIETGTLRASITAAPVPDALPDADEVTVSEEVEIET
jgi:hypothetical protein